MKLVDYEKYYHSGSEFIIPRDEFEKIIEENQRLKNIIYTTLEYVDREEVSSVGTPFTSTSIGKEIKELLEGEKTFNSIWKENQRLKERIEYLERSNNRREDTIMSLRDEITEQKDYENVLNELKWKPIEKYEKPKYDWVLVKYFIEPNFECIPCIAENRFGKWYARNDELIYGDVRYFFDMQQLDKLNELKESDK